MNLRDLSSDALVHLLDSVQALNALDSMEAFRSDGLSIVEQILPHEAFSCLWFATGSKAGEWLPGSRCPYSEKEQQGFRDQLEAHPLAESFREQGESAALRLTDLLSVLDWRRHPVYRACREAHRLAYTLALKVSTESGRSLWLFYDRSLFDFDDREVLLLSGLRPHLEQWLDRFEPHSQTASSCPKAKNRPTGKKLAGELGVTSREAEILLLAAEGLSDKAIAKRCGLHFTTVKKHLRNAYSKLPVTGRHAAAMLVLEKTGRLQA